MNTSVKIRPATHDDAAEIFRVHVTSVREVCSADYTLEEIEAWVGPRRPEHILWGMTKNGETMLVAEEDSEIVGFGSLKGDRIIAVYVLPNRLRRGIGKRIIEHLKENARERKIAGLKLDSTVTAVPFYTAQGYAVVEYGHHDFKSGHRIACAYMHKVLTQG